MNFTDEHEMFFLLNKKLKTKSLFDRIKKGFYCFVAKVRR